jgi:hypothetical protein
MKHLWRLFGRAVLGLPVLLVLVVDSYSAEMKKLTVNVRQMGGMTEMAAAFQRRQIAGAVISALRVADNSVIDRLVREGFIEKLYKKR